MVVISASICNKNGKILMARQFIPITRMKLEEYVANFPKLIESGINSFRRLLMDLCNRKAVYAYRDRKYKIRVSADRQALFDFDYE